MTKAKAELQKEILDKLQKMEDYIKETRQMLGAGTVTSKNYFPINTSAFHIDQLMWEYLK